MPEIEYGCQARELDGSTGHQGFMVSKTGNVDCVARGKVVAAIEDYIGRRDQAVELQSIGAQRNFHADGFGIDLGYRKTRGGDLGEPDRRCPMCNLALEIAKVDVVVVAEGQLTHAAGCKIECSGRTQSAQAYDQNTPIQYALLTFNADFVEQYVAGIARELSVVHALFVFAQFRRNPSMLMMHMLSAYFDKHFLFILLGDMAFDFHVVAACVLAVVDDVAGHLMQKAAV